MTNDDERLAAYVIAAKLPHIVTDDGDNDLAREVNEQAAWEVIDALHAADLVITHPTPAQPTTGDTE